MVDRLRSLSIRSCAREIYREEGLAGFTRGLFLRTAGTALITSILFISYEKSKAVFHDLLYGSESSENSHS